MPSAARRRAGGVDLPARALMSALFLVSGFGKVTAAAATQAYMAAHGVPAVLLWPAAALEIGGGVLLLLGLGLRPLGLVLAGWCLLTAAIFHTAFADQDQTINFLKNLAMAGGFLLLAGRGAPTLGLDGARAARRSVPARDPDAGPHRGAMSMTRRPVRRTAPVLAAAGPMLAAAGLAFHPSPARAAGPAPAFAFAADPVTSAGQHAAYDVVHRYETLLNAGDTAGILALYAPDGVAEWNDRPTFATLAEKREAYDALFRRARFTTAFGYADIDVVGDTAVVRTFHHRGATVTEDGKQVVDLNREVFVLHRIGGAWKISLYIFNTDPVQGEG